MKSSCTVTFSEPFQPTLAAQSALYVEPDFMACHDLFETLALAREGCRILRHIKANILRLGPIGASTQADRTGGSRKYRRKTTPPTGRPAASTVRHRSIRIDARRRSATPYRRSG